MYCGPSHGLVGVQLGTQTTAGGDGQVLLGGAVILVAVALAVTGGTGLGLDGEHALEGHTTTLDTLGRDDLHHRLDAAFSLGLGDTFTLGQHSGALFHSSNHILHLLSLEVQNRGVFSSPDS